MATFDYRKFLKENKSTFHASLTEGQFSWMTQDTEQQIGSERENTLPFVYMHDDKGNKWLEKNYDGYGEFGGKDYYDLVAEMNGYTLDDAEKLGGTFNDLRGIGIKLAFGELEPKNGGPVLFPALTVSATLPNGHDFTKEAETDPNQSWYAEEEDEDGYDEDEDELFEVNSKDASDIAKKFAQYMSKKEGKKFTVTPGSVDEKSFDLDVDGEKYMGGSYLIKDNGDIVNVAMGNKVSGNVNQLKEGETIEKNKMTKEELKAEIKEMILAEMDENKMYDPLYEADDEEEVEDTEEVDVDIEDPEPSAEPEVKGGINVTQNADADLTGVEKEAQDNLEAALEAAKKLGDDKLVKQIGNSLTFFTRQHIVKENKEIFPMLKRILK